MLDLHMVKELIGIITMIAGATGAIATAFFAWKKFYSFWKEKLSTIKKRIDQIDQISNTLGPNGGKSLYDIVHNIDKKSSITEVRSEVISALVGLGEWTCDANGLVLKVNDIVSKLVKRSEEDFQGNNWLSIVHPDDREAVDEEWSRSISQNRHFRANFRLIDIDGRSLRVEVISKPIYTSGKGLTGYLSTIRFLDFQTKNPD